MVNVTASGETSAGADLAVYPTGQVKPKNTSLWPQIGATVSNEVVVKVGSGGKVSLATAKGATNVSVDVVGYFAPDDGYAYSPAPSAPLVNTAGTTVPIGWPARQPLVAGGSFAKIDVPVAGVADVPADAAAVAVSLSVTNPSVPGSKVSVYPSGTTDAGPRKRVHPVRCRGHESCDRAGGLQPKDLSGHRERFGACVAGDSGLLRTDRHRPVLPATDRTRARHEIHQPTLAPTQPIGTAPSVAGRHVCTGGSRRHTGQCAHGRPRALGG